MPRKNFTAPVWWLAVMMLFQLLMLISLYVATRKYAGTDMSFTSAYIERGAYLAVIIGEGVFYWLYRARIRARRNAWYHIIGMLLTFVVLPLFLTVYTTYISLHSSGAADFSDKAALLNKIWMISFWGLFIVSHIFFVILIGKGLGVEVAEEEVTDGQDILTPYEDRV